MAVEDISALLVENRASTVTAAALSYLGQSGCAVFICDEKHMPCAVLEPELKRLMFNSLNHDILSGGSHHSVSYAVERLVYSLSRSLAEGKAELCLPELIDIEQHRYE